MSTVDCGLMEDSAYQTIDDFYNDSHEPYHVNNKVDNYESYTSSTSSISSDDSLLGAPTKRIVEVYCPNMHLGCPWSGSLDNIIDHTANDCFFTEVTCNSCCRNLPHNMMDEHLKSDCKLMPKQLMPFSKSSEEMSVIPVLVMMQSFEEKRMKNERWCSPVLVTHKNGYHFKLKIDVNGWSNNDAIAMVVSLVKGDHDDELPWPFEGIITVQVLNQIRDAAHSKPKKFVFCGGGLECQQVVDETLPEFGCWCDHVISHRSLNYKSSKQCQYLKDDCLYFLVSYSALK